MNSMMQGHRLLHLHRRLAQRRAGVRAAEKIGERPVGALDPSPASQARMSDPATPPKGTVDLQAGDAGMTVDDAESQAESAHLTVRSNDLLKSNMHESLREAQANLLKAALAAEKYYAKDKRAKIKPGVAKTLGEKILKWLSGKLEEHVIAAVATAAGLPMLGACIEVTKTIKEKLVGTGEEAEQEAELVAVDTVLRDVISQSDGAFDALGRQIKLVDGQEALYALAERMNLTQPLFSLAEAQTGITVIIEAEIRKDLPVNAAMDRAREVGKAVAGVAKAGASLEKNGVE